DTFTTGWRWVYAIGALLALISLVLRIALPESPRWLANQGRTEEAERVIESMESLALRKGELLPENAVDAVVPQAPNSTWAALRDVFTSGFYLKRLAVLGLAWLLGYTTVYA